MIDTKNSFDEFIDEILRMREKFNTVEINVVPSNVCIDDCKGFYQMGMSLTKACSMRKKN